jgi:hypothetical protein
MSPVVTLAIVITLLSRVSTQPEFAAVSQPIQIKDEPPSTHPIGCDAYSASVAQVSRDAESATGCDGVSIRVFPVIPTLGPMTGQATTVLSLQRDMCLAPRRVYQMRSHLDGWPGDGPRMCSGDRQDGCCRDGLCDGECWLRCAWLLRGVTRTRAHDAQQVQDKSGQHEACIAQNREDEPREAIDYLAFVHLPQPWEKEAQEHCSSSTPSLRAVSHCSRIRCRGTHVGDVNDRCRQRNLVTAARPLIVVVKVLVSTRPCSRLCGRLPRNHSSGRGNSHGGAAGLARSLLACCCLRHAHGSAALNAGEVNHNVFREREYRSSDREKRCGRQSNNLDGKRPEYVKFPLHCARGKTKTIPDVLDVSRAPEVQSAARLIPQHSLFTLDRCQAMLSIDSADLPQVICFYVPAQSLNSFRLILSLRPRPP